MSPKRIISGLYRGWRDVKRKNSRFEVSALVGRAGTGKSFRARLIADDHGIDAILDDGLLIQHGKIIAGRSAKQESHYLSAVKTALFSKPEHRDEVRTALRKGSITKILVLGTSDRMIDRICKTLELPPPKRVVRIEDIATREEIEAATHDRKTYGKHVIPIPIIEVKQAYPQMFAHAIKVWVKKGIHLVTHEKNGAHYEKTIVKPNYHAKGAITISETALSQMILHCFREKAPTLTARKIRIRHGVEGYDITVHLSLPFHENAAARCSDLQAYTTTKLQEYCGIQINRFTIRIDTVEAPLSSETKEH